jgi:hypothetical protein
MPLISDWPAEELAPTNKTICKQTHTADKSQWESKRQDALGTGSEEFQLQSSSF